MSNFEILFYTPEHWLILIAGIVLGKYAPSVFSYFRNKFAPRKEDVDIKRALFRLDAEIKGIKSLISDKKNEDVQLLNDQLEQDLGDDSHSS